MQKIYLPKKKHDFLKETTNRQLILYWENWVNDCNIGSPSFELIDSINSNCGMLSTLDAIIKIIKGEIEVLPLKEIKYKYRLYHEQEPSAGKRLFKYHYFTKNAGLDETDCFENVDTFTKEEAYKLIDNLGEWLEEWLHEVEE